MGERDLKQEQGQVSKFDQLPVIKPDLIREEIKDRKEALKEAKILADEIVSFLGENPDRKIKNYLLGLNENSSMKEIHAALGKTLAETMVSYYIAKGIKPEELKNIKITLGNGKKEVVHLIKADGTVEDDPQKLIGMLTGGKYDYNGANGKITDSKDGILEKITSQGRGVANTRNSCNGQLIDEIRRYLIAMPRPVTTAAPMRPIAQPIREHFNFTGIDEGNVIDITPYLFGASAVTQSNHGPKEGVAHNSLVIVRQVSAPGFLVSGPMTINESMVCPPCLPGLDGGG